MLTPEEERRAEELFERFLELAPDDPDADAARDILSYLDAS